MIGFILKLARLVGKYGARAVNAAINWVYANWNNLWSWISRLDPEEIVRWFW